MFAPMARFSASSRSRLRLAISASTAASLSAGLTSSKSCSADGCSGGASLGNVSQPETFCRWGVSTIIDTYLFCDVAFCSNARSPEAP